MTELQASAGQSDRLHVAIVAGSTRPRRKSLEVAGWLHGLAAERQDARFEVVDIADYDLPLLDEPIPPMAGQCGVPISNDHPRPRPSSVMRTYERGRR